MVSTVTQVLELGDPTFPSLLAANMIFGSSSSYLVLLFCSRWWNLGSNIAGGFWGIKADD